MEALRYNHICRVRAQEFLEALLSLSRPCHLEPEKPTRLVPKLMGVGDPWAEPSERG
jgi:hypothetical protein